MKAPTIDTIKTAINMANPDIHPVDLSLSVSAVASEIIIEIIAHTNKILKVRSSNYSQTSYKKVFLLIGGRLLFPKAYSRACKSSYVPGIPFFLSVFSPSIIKSSPFIYSIS